MKLSRSLSVIVPIILPTFSWESGTIALHAVALVTKAYLGIWMARLDGRIVGAALERRSKLFLKSVGIWLLVAVPSTFLNSIIRFMEAKLAHLFRRRLTLHAYSRYMKNDAFYLIKSSTTLGPRNIEHELTQGIDDFCHLFAHLHSHLSKPIIDLLLFGYELVGQVGGRPMGAVACIVLFSAELLRRYTPDFGKLAAEQADLEGTWRCNHARLAKHAEEIAFYDAGDSELVTIRRSFDRMWEQASRVLYIKIPFRMFEQLLMKHCWDAAGLVS
jgi:ATP-binding cassette subfamily D (ALD) long-chain fatty acid import protein